MGGSSSKSSSTPVDMTPQSFKDLQGPFAGVLSNLLGQYNSSMGSSLLQGYQGPTTTPITGTESADLSKLNATANTATPTLTPADYVKQINGASGTGAFSADPNDPTLNGAITAAQRSTVQGLNTALGRTLPSQFVQSGQQVQGNGSSAFDRAAALAYGQGASALGDIATNMQYSNTNDAKNREATAISQVPAVNTANAGIKTADVNNMISNLNAQALPRQIADLGVERGMEAYNNNINSILAGLGIVSGTTRPVVSSSSNSSSGGVQLK